MTVDLTIEEGNKIIHLFVIKGTVSHDEYEMRSLKHLSHFGELEYHSSWDCLMRVWVKLRKDVFKNMYGYTDEFETFKERFLRDVFIGDIGYAQKTIADAIQWYNQKNEIINEK
jgi:hypothetical protein